MSILAKIALAFAGLIAFAALICRVIERERVSHTYRDLYRQWYSQSRFNRCLQVLAVVLTVAYGGSKPELVKPPIGSGQGLEEITGNQVSLLGTGGHPEFAIFEPE